MKRAQIITLFVIGLVIVLSNNCWARASDDYYREDNVQAAVIPGVPYPPPPQWAPVQAAVPVQLAANAEAPVSTPEAAATDAAAAVTAQAQTAAYNDTMSQWQQYIDKETDPAKKAKIIAQAEASAKNAAKEVGDKTWEASKGAFTNYFQKNPQDMGKNIGAQVANNAVSYAAGTAQSAYSATYAQWQPAIKAANYDPQVIARAQTEARSSYNNAFNKSIIKYLNKTFFGRE